MNIERKKKIQQQKHEWDLAHTKQIKMKLNLNTDADIIAYLGEKENTQGYLKNLIRYDMAREAAKKTTAAGSAEE